MHSFKFYYLEACENFRYKPSEKLLSKIEQSGDSSRLNLSSIELCDDTCKTIGHALRKDVFLEELDISNCVFSDDGLSSILSGLDTNRFLLSLNLKGNNIRSAGTAFIGKLLRHNSRLKNLSLEWNATGIFPEKFSYLCEGLAVNSSLKSLDLRNNQLNHVCAQSIAEVIHRNSTLQELDLRWNSIGLIGGRTILQSLSRNKSIIKLHTTGNDVPFEIERSIEFVTSTAAERYIKNNEDLEKTKFFASKLQDLEVEKDRQLRSFMEQLEKKDKGCEISERWNCSKLTQLQEKITEKDYVIEDLIRKSQELSKELSVVTKEKNSVCLALDEMEIQFKESKKDFQFILNKERKEKEDMERKSLEEMGAVKEEYLVLRKQIHDDKIVQEDLDDQNLKLKNKISKLEKKLKFEEASFKEQKVLLDEKYQENMKEIDLIRKDEISKIKEGFSEIEKNLKEQVNFLENRNNDLEKQIMEKNAQMVKTKACAEKMVETLRKEMEDDKEKLKKQMEDRIELLESQNKKQNELLKDQLETLLEIKRKYTEKDILLSEEAHQNDQLKHNLESKDAEMNATIMKIRIEVKDQLEELSQVKTLLKNSTTEYVSLKQKITEMEKEHQEQMQNKDEELQNLKHEIKKQKNKVKEILHSENKRIGSLQSAFTSYLNSVKLSADEADLEDKLKINC